MSDKEAQVARSIAGLFADRAAAERAIGDLKNAGFNPDHIGIVMRDRGEAQAVADDQGVNSTAGAVTGGVIGGTAGALLAATGALAVPGVGPFNTGGILASLVGGTAGWLIGGLVGMGVPREEAEYYQRRVEQGDVLVTVDPQGRDEEARQILLRAGAQGERTQGAVTLAPTAGATAYPTETVGPYAAERAQGVAPPPTPYPAATGETGAGVDASPAEVGRRGDVSGSATSCVPQGARTDRIVPRGDQQYPPAESGIAPGTMSDARTAGGGAAGTSAPEQGVGSQLGGVQPSAVSDQTPQGQRGDLLHREQPERRVAAQPDDGMSPTGAASSDASPTWYSDTVTSSGAQEGADYNRDTDRPPDGHPITDADIIAQSEGQRRETQPDLDVTPAEDEEAASRRGLL